MQSLMTSLSCLPTTYHPPNNVRASENIQGSPSSLIQCFTVLPYAISTFVHLIMLVVLCFDYTSKSITMIHTSSSSVSLIVIICLEGARGPDQCAYSSMMLPQYVLKLSIAVCLSVYTTLCPIPNS